MTRPSRRTPLINGNSAALRDLRNAGFLPLIMVWESRE